MVSVTSFELIPSEPNGDIQENIQSAEFEVFQNPDEVEHSENAPLNSDTCIPDMTTTEMCDRLKKLLQENVDLKGKLQRNNQVMHEQLNIIATWRDQIQQTNIKHRTMLEDLVWQNQKLQDEKAELGKRIEELENPSSADEQLCAECDVYKNKSSDLEERLAQTVAEKENIAEELQKSKKMLEKTQLELLPSTFKFQESASARRGHEQTGSLATIVTDDDSDYAIIIKEDFPLQKAENNVDFKEIVFQCEKLQIQVAELSQQLSDEMEKSENLEKILEAKEQELQTLQIARSELENQNSESMSIVTEWTEDQKKLLTTLRELKTKAVETTQERDDQKLKSENLEKILEAKEQELQTLQIARSELEIQNSESMSIVTECTEDQKKLLTTLSELKTKVVEITQERDDQKLEFENLLEICEKKELELKDLQNAHSELRCTTDSISIISAFDNDQKQMSSALSDLETKMISISTEREEEKLKCENIEKLLKEKEQELEDFKIVYSEIENENIENISIISLLKEDIKKLSCAIHELQSFRDRCESLEDQAKLYKKKFDELQFIRCEKEHVIEKLQKELKVYGEELSKEQVQNELHKKSLIAAEQNFMQLYEEQQRMVKMVVDQKQDIQNQCQQMTSIEATERAEHQNNLDSLTAKLFDMEERLHAEDEKVSYLKREVKTLTEDSECIPILKAQVEIYKTELETEKRAKSDVVLRELALSHEVTDLKEQIKNLQEMIVNQPHLQHRGSSHHSRRWSSSGQSHGKQSRGRSSTDHENTNGTAEPVQVYACPCCPLTFTDVNAVQNHVERCLTETCP